jgi:hypothetical protein
MRNVSVGCAGSVGRTASSTVFMTTTMSSGRTPLRVSSALYGSCTVITASAIRVASRSTKRMIASALAAHRRPWNRMSSMSGARSCTSKTMRAPKAFGTSAAATRKSGGLCTWTTA